ncbi:MAG: guanylate kinase [Opitutales bacterium]|nr:guanylate kinase [Opitutales bacterium]|tara:strand:- start:657 stop:1274 length:618 start_codon:yes stop_codon:yes gene_type:complete
METIPENEVALLLILAGPAGSGKTTLCDRLVDENGHLERVVTCTTRAPREGEIDGVDYYFFSDDQFDAKVEDGEFLEWAHVHTYRYGTLKSTIEAKLEDDVDLVMNIDVQGVASVQEAARNQPMIGQRLVTVFIMPASFDELKERLRGRGKDDELEISCRIESAEKEIEQWRSFDYLLRSKSKAEDFSAIASIWRAEKRRVARYL